MNLKKISLRIAWAVAWAFLFAGAIYISGADGIASHLKYIQTSDELESAKPTKEIPASFVERLCQTALERTKHQVIYDGSYCKIDYPGGDVADDRGVCTDVVIRAYRGVGVDLQQKIHVDIARNFRKYPQIWGASGPDANIDHRRVPNLMTFLKRKNASLPITRFANDYAPADIVAWRLPNGLTHIGIIVDKKSDDGKRLLIVHNIGEGPKLEDVLFDWKIIGHYRYMGQ